ncbi:MAG: DNA primase [Omnitrophica WOR_2 bacterium RIFCSPHIGHO2_02_FULL_67_20]|nr:MAG: DNA primase [Omnitrophica WOR_2 bacterium RIFCSPHIGHO2_02_FULL_67_20]
MPLIPETLIDEIQARTDIAELIGHYVPLKRAGRHFKATCPFHKERTPSFMVNTDKQIFHCFGCGIGGNVFSFLMQHDRVTFPEAVRQLAEQAGVRLPEREEASSGAQHAREALAALTEKSCRYFERLLRDPAQGATARAYVKARGVSDEARDRFRLGFAPEGWDHLLRATQAKGVSVEQLDAAGLVVRGTSGYYDRFRGRLMFPIMDVRGRVIGFGGRSLGGQEPKYLNGPETPLYTKGHHLFGLAQAKEAIARTRTAVVVEGYFDCVVLADAGVANVVSPLGTALTAEQGRLLKRYADRVILAFDADAAGEQATLRGIDVLVELGLRVHVAGLPAGIDPDEHLRAHGREAFEALLERSAGIFEVLVESALRRYPRRTTEDKVSAAQFVLPTIARIPDAMLRSEYVRLLAERLRLDEQAVAEELAKAQPRAVATPRRAGATPTGRNRVSARAAARASTASGAERLLAALVLEEPARFSRLQERLKIQWLSDPAVRQILAVVGELSAGGQTVSPAHVISRLSAAQTEVGPAALVTELVELAQSVSARDEAFEDCARRLESRARSHELLLLRERIRAAQDAGHERDVTQLLAEYQQRLAAPPDRAASAIGAGAVER